MTRLVLVELYKLRRRPMTKVLLLVLVGLFVILYLLLFAVANTVTTSATNAPDAQQLRNLLGLPTALPFALATLQSLGTVLGVILAAGMIGSEYSWGSIRTILTYAPGRISLFFSKLIALLVLVFAGAIIGLVIGLIMSIITTYLGGGTPDFAIFTPAYLRDQSFQFWRTLYVIIPYLLLAFLLSIWGRSTLPGIGLGIGVFVLESIVTTLMGLAGGWVARLPQFLLSANVNALMAYNKLPEGARMGMGTSANEPGTSLPNAWQATGALAVYCVVFALLAIQLFRKRDITP